MMDWQTLARRAAITLGFALIFLLVFAIGFRREAWRHYIEGRDAEHRGETELAVALYDRAIRNHYPFSAVRGQARDRLMVLGREHQDAGQDERAREVYQTLLSALSAVETGFSRERPLITRLEEKVDALTPPLAPFLARSPETTPNS